jgi:hypothetical protein
MGKVGKWFKKHKALIDLYRLCRRNRAWAESADDPLARRMCVFMFSSSREIYSKLAPSWWPEIKPLNSAILEA